MPSATLTPTTRLSVRELQVLEALVRGATDKEVGEALGISLGTVRVYRRRVSDKLGTKALVPMALVAWRRGQLDLDGLADEVLAAVDARSRP